jgi:hypothetical protein
MSYLQHTGPGAVSFIAIPQTIRKSLFGFAVPGDPGSSSTASVASENTRGEKNTDKNKGWKKRELLFHVS